MIPLCLKNMESQFEKTKIVCCCYHGQFLRKHHNFSFLLISLSYLYEQTYLFIICYDLEGTCFLFSAFASTTSNDTLIDILFHAAKCLMSVVQVATFIVQRILHEEIGLSYVCVSYERFSQVAMILVRFTV